MPPLAALCPPATVIDKTRYSALAESKLAEYLRQREADALEVMGKFCVTGGLRWLGWTTTIAMGICVVVMGLTWVV
jgi:isochorismate hydrolase